MVHCLSAECGKQIEPEWSFCPYCGTDNRAPELRKPVDGCPHEYFEEYAYCMKCGFDRIVSKKPAYNYDWVNREPVKVEKTDEEETFFERFWQWITNVEAWVWLIVLAAIIFFGAFYMLAGLGGSRNRPVPTEPKGMVVQPGIK